MFHVEHWCGKIRRLVESAVQNSSGDVGSPADKQVRSPRTTKAASFAEPKTRSRNELRQMSPSTRLRVGAIAGGSASVARAPRIETFRLPLCDQSSLDTKLSTCEHHHWRFVGPIGIRLGWFGRAADGSRQGHARPRSAISHAYSLGAISHAYSLGGGVARGRIPESGGLGTLMYLVAL